MGRQGDTIAAVATPAGPGAIGILRLSGPGAADIAAACFRPLGRKGLWTIPPARWYMAACWTVRAKSLTRCCVLTAAVRPAILGRTQRSSTATAPPWSSPWALRPSLPRGPPGRPGGVHPAGLSQRAAGPCPGGGCGRPAGRPEPGGARQAAGQLSGALSRKIAAIYSALVDVMAHFHAVLDYPDEDIDPFTQEQLARDLEAQRQDLEALLSTYQRGRRLSRGVKCAIVGRPNAGKSSLLNTLAGYDRAIVTDIPGTTRDTVEETVELGASLCGSSTRQVFGTAAIPLSSWGWSAAAGPWRRRSSSWWCWISPSPPGRRTPP